ncbi:MAG: FAD-dependent oxidoreductase, partial [Phycisphaerae bacterium]
DLGLAVDERGNLVVGADFQTSARGVFAAGDAVAGASLAVRAMDQGRQAAETIARYLQGR